LVKKLNGTRRMFIDFTDLDKACPKDSYPLLITEKLVDSTTGYELLHGFLLKISPDPFS